MGAAERGGRALRRLRSPERGVATGLSMLESVTERAERERRERERAGILELVDAVGQEESDAEGLEETAEMQKLREKKSPRETKKSKPPVRVVSTAEILGGERLVSEPGGAVLRELALGESRVFGERGGGSPASSGGRSIAASSGGSSPSIVERSKAAEPGDIFFDEKTLSSGVIGGPTVGPAGAPLSTHTRCLLHFFSTGICIGGMLVVGRGSLREGTEFYL